MNDLNISIRRLHQFLAGTLPGQIATSTVAADIQLVSHELGYTDFWRPRLACARRMLANRQASERTASHSCEAARKKRQLKNRDRRAEENRQMAAGMGTGKKKQ
ncbi:MAG: hypothetical protein HYT39_02375 [Candidatus Sungbacteria bacterium]|nr:hypothetical protein [Candidatus Sungbacteria bacterium]